MPASTDLQLTDVASALDGLLTWHRRSLPAGEYSLTARATLGRLRDGGPARITDLARAEAVTQPAMTGLVNRLKAEALVRREADPRDARASLVVLTDSGRALIDERRAARSNELATQLERLPEADRAALLAAVPALEAVALLVRD